MNAACSAGWQGAHGTWDFKWRRAQRIRVAFQELPVPLLQEIGLPFEGLVGHVRALAELWLSQRPNIFFDFDVPHLPAPPPGYSNSRLPKGSALPSYDVLVSLAPLPVIDPGAGLGDAREISAPQSQLGTYALRGHYGAPTTFLGRYAGMKLGLAEYFRSPWFRHIVVHEFGHVLGLAHEHQNPRAAIAWKEPSELVRLVQRVMGLTPTEEFVRQEFCDPWPASWSPDGQLLFSDWREVREPEDCFDSAMSFPFWKCALQSERHADCVSSELDCACMDFKEAPTTSDLSHLASMYREG